jgi:hypothetical protein
MPKVLDREAPREHSGISASEMMLLYKVLPCPKKYAHDTRACVFAHNLNYRRNIIQHPFMPVMCSKMRTARLCPKGDNCPKAHSLQEMWLHPMMFKTAVCREGSMCDRYLCFFAHNVNELRLPCSIERLIEKALHEKINDLYNTGASRL